MERKKNEGKQSIVYFSQRPTLSSNGLYVIFAGITHPSPEYYITRTERSGIFWGGVYVFEYILLGRGYIECEDERYEVKAGDFIFMNARRNIVYYSDSNEPYEKMWVNFTGPYVASLVSGLSLDKPFYIIAHDLYKEMSSIHRYLSRINSDNRDYYLDKIALEICGIFLTLNNIERRKEKKEITDKFSTADKIKDYIDSLVIPNINLDDISRIFSLDKGYIIHRFTHKYGISPYKYINQRRIEAAKIMLTENTMKISEISSALGYGGTQHFSSSFKNATGKTPKEFASKYK